MIATKQGEGTTTIGRGASLRGDLKTTGDIIIDGNLEGSLEADGSRVTVGREARVQADIVAREVVIEGRVTGTVRATERAELRASAVVEGNVYAKRFAMEDNAVLRGHVDPTIATETPKAQVPTAQTSAPARPATPTLAHAVESPSLFVAQRPGAAMPAGLAAAARNFGTGPAAGLTALTEDRSSEAEKNS